MSLPALIKVLLDNPLEVWTKAHFEEPIVRGGLPLVRVLVVSQPGAIRHILVENEANYRRADLQQRVLSAGLRGGLLTSEGEQWRRQRHLIAPLLARKAVANFAPAMLDVGDACVARWSKLPEGAVLDANAEVTGLALEVLERTIFFDGLHRDIGEFRAALRTYFDSIGRIDPFDVLGLPAFIPRFTRWRARPVLRFFDAAVDDIIAASRGLLAEGPDRAPRDVLTLLLAARDPQTGSGLTDDELRANIITLIAAGHETTANALTWSLFLLAQSKEWGDRVAAEAEHELTGAPAEACERLVETRAVLEEALRLYPPIVATSRVAIRADTFAGHRIDPGTMVVVAPYVLHRHKSLWQDPDAFDPGRFLGEARKHIDRYAYLPFGAGPRICIGAAFALQEATLLLAAIWKNFELHVAPGVDVTPQLRIALRPKGGLPMILHRRRPQPAVAAPGPTESELAGSVH